MKRSKDSGATWSALQIVYSNSSDTYGNITIGNAAPGASQRVSRASIVTVRRSLRAPGSSNLYSSTKHWSHSHDLHP